MTMRREIPNDGEPRAAWERLADWLLGDGPLVGVAVAGALFTAALIIVNVWRVVA